MALKDNVKFNSIKNEVNTEYESIIKDNLDDKINKIANLLKIDNTNENIVFEYLNLMKSKLEKSTDDTLKKILLQYECCIEEVKFNQAFQVVKVTKTSYKKRIMQLILLIKEYNSKKELDDKIELLEKIDSQKVEKFENTFPINYNVNLELFFYSLYEILYMQILYFYKNNFVTKNDIEEHILKPTIEKSRLLFCKDEENSEKIKYLDKKLKYIPFIYGTFNKHISNFSRFIAHTNANFCKRFESDPIKDEKELLLFTDYIFFLSYYPFIKYDATEYAFIWNDTFLDMKIEDKIKLAESFSISLVSYKLDNNILKVIDNHQKEEMFSIPNIDDYSLITLMDYLLMSGRKPDLIELNRFLKIDKYSEKLYIRKIWKSWEEFLIKALSSNMVESVFKKIFDGTKNIKDDNKSSLYSFFDKEEIKLIINNSRYFIFDSDFYRITIGKNLLIYLNGDPYLVKGDPIQSKIFFLSNNVKSNLYEIVGYLNIMFQYYLSKDERYKLPKLNQSQSSTQEKSIKDKDVRKFIEELIFGKLSQYLTIEQMLYILDIKNYEKDYISFREGLVKCREEKGYKISPEFKVFLNQLDINSEEIRYEYKGRFPFIEFYKNEREFNKSEHPLDGYNDIYD